MKKTIYITLALIVFTFAAAGTSLACSCVATRESVKTQVSNAYKDSTAIFSGKVTAIEQTADGNTYVVKFAVKDTWKGAGGTEITVRTETQSSMCGYRFALGREYVVYAYQSTNTLGVNNCSRTAIADSNGDVTYLAKLRKKYAKAKQKMRRSFRRYDRADST
jgi:hypothetical protein